MSVWDIYKIHTGQAALSKRESVLSKEQMYLRRRLPHSLSYHHMVINHEERDAAVISTDNTDIKILCSMPGEDIEHGSLVFWMNNYWLVTEREADNEVYTRCKMRQCNHLLKWINPDGVLIERWCVVEDGTKYLTGEYGDNDYIITKGDSRIGLTIARDQETLKLNRESRFIIDDPDSVTNFAYRLTKPLRLGNSYNGKGVLIFVLTECNTEDDDNLELGIADYYKVFPKDTAEIVSEPAKETESEDEPVKRKGWI